VGAAESTGATEAEDPTAESVGWMGADSVCDEPLGQTNQTNPITNTSTTDITKMRRRQ